MRTSLQQLKKIRQSDCMSFSRLVSIGSSLLLVSLHYFCFAAEAFTGINNQIAFCTSSKIRAMTSINKKARLSESSSNLMASSSTENEIVKAAKDMNGRAKDVSPLTEDELDMIVQSMKNIAPEKNELHWNEIRQLLADVAHLSHKDWDRTGDSAAALRKLLLGQHDGGLLMPDFQKMFRRIMEEGNWYGAASHASSYSEEQKPWVVLVTGVNGIRKTTSVYQPWFTQLLEEALVTPTGDEGKVTESVLPTGENSFFRQLDHMIISLTNVDFKRLYHLTSQLVTDQDDIDKGIIQSYSDYKAAIFARFRTLSEILGVLLVREANGQNLNVMIETSGRDIAMFHYVDKYFPSSDYNKLALHFFVDDLSHAESSVDQRMLREIRDGISALSSEDVQQIINANAGGPYGSEVLKGVQADSDRVWDQVVIGGEGGGVGKDWYKASIRIDGHSTEPWTARAIKPDGSEGTLHKFILPKHMQEK